MQPKIVYPHEGYHNQNWDEAVKGVAKTRLYEDLSCVCIIPTRGMLPVEHVSSFNTLIRPFNHKFYGPIYIAGMEVGSAYNAIIQQVLTNPDTKNYKYLLTVEDDMIIPPRGLLDLLESIGDYDMIGGIYWMKTQGGIPVMFGDMSEPENYKPVVPLKDAVQPVYGCGMGFNLWKLDIFREMEYPWFETVEEFDGKDITVQTQDITFFKKANAKGYKFAINTSVKCGHIDAEGAIW